MIFFVAEHSRVLVTELEKSSETKLFFKFFMCVCVCICQLHLESVCEQFDLRNLYVSWEDFVVTDIVIFLTCTDLIVVVEVENQHGLAIYAPLKQGQHWKNYLFQNLCLTLVYAYVYVLIELEDATWKLLYTYEMTFDLPELDCTEEYLCGWLDVKIQFQTNLMPVSLSQSHHLCSLCAISILCVVSLWVNFLRVSLELGLLA